MTWFDRDFFPRGTWFLSLSNSRTRRDWVCSWSSRHPIISADHFWSCNRTGIWIWCSNEHWQWYRWRWDWGPLPFITGSQGMLGHRHYVKLLIWHPLQVKSSRLARSICRCNPLKLSEGTGRACVSVTVLQSIIHVPDLNTPRCRRLSLIPLCYLWQRDQADLLSEMIDAGMNVILIKVAGIGLKPQHLGKTLSQMQPTLIKLVMHTLAP